MTASIVAESGPRGEQLSAVASQNELDPSQIHGWRTQLIRQCKEQEPDFSALKTESVAFVPAVIMPVSVTEAMPSRRAPRGRRRAASALVQLEIDGVAVTVVCGVDAGVIAIVIDPLRTLA